MATAQLDTAFAHDIVVTRDVTEIHLAELMAGTHSLARSYNYESPGRILNLALPRYHETKVASESTRDPRQLAELHYILGRLHAVMAYATLDLGRDEAAANHARALIHSASYAGHSELEAWGCGTLSMILRFQGRNSQSIDWALKGRSCLP